MRDWDGVYDADAAAPALFAAFEIALLDQIYKDELGAAFPWARGRRSQILLDAFAGPLAPWCDDRDTEETETCEALLAPALSAAVDGLVAIYGDDFANWRWSEMLVIRHSHSGFGFLPVIGDIFSRETHVAGGPASPNVAYYRSGAVPEIIGVAHGPSLRFIADLADPDANDFVISSGQSGHFNSPHYDDLQQLWARGRYIRLPMRAAAIETVYELTLRPE